MENLLTYVAIYANCQSTTDRLGESYKAFCIVISSSPAYADGKLVVVQKFQHETDKAQN